MVNSSLIQINGPIEIRNDRDVNGGGVILYFRSNFTLTKLAFSSTTGPRKSGIQEYSFCTL